MNEQTAETHAHSCMFCEASDAIRRFARTMGPSEEVTSHFRQSRIEFLKGIRRMIDEKIEHIDRNPRGTRVTVD